MRQETVHIGNYFNCPAYFTLKEGIKSQFCFFTSPILQHLQHPEGGCQVGFFYEQYCQCDVKCN